jgi:hypothetical protein
MMSLITAMGGLTTPDSQYANEAVLRSKFLLQNNRTQFSAIQILEKALFFAFNFSTALLMAT